MGINNLSPIFPPPITKPLIAFPTDETFKASDDHHVNVGEAKKDIILDSHTPTLFSGGASENMAPEVISRWKDAEYWSRSND